MKSRHGRKPTQKKRGAAAQRKAARARLRGSVLRYERPTEPVIDPRER